MKILTVFLSFCLSLILLGFSGKEISGTSSQMKSDSIHRKSDLSKENLKGKVKRVTDTLYDAVERSGKVETGYINGITVTDFNTLGFVIGRITSHPKDEYWTRCITKFDEKGFETGTDYFSPDGSIYQKESCRCDKKGNVIESILSKGKGEIIQKSTNKYDSLGNLIEISTYIPDGDFIYKSSFLNDNKGNRIEENEAQTNSGILSKNVFKYDENSNRIEMQVCNSGKVKFTYTYQYFQFDSFGNWVKEISYVEGTYASMIHKRVIEYYP